MTKRLYLDDSYKTSFEADILERRDTDRGPALVLTATYFYPESGGQPEDLGTIGGIPVTGVRETDDGVILHFVERAPAERHVACVIEEERRRDHMQQHAGQHILSRAFEREAGARTTSFHLGAETSTIDLDRPGLGEEDVARAERAANDVVRKALPIRLSYFDAEAAKHLGLRKLPSSGERVRIVDVEGFDQQPCCGTHPSSSAEVGPIVTRAVEKAKGGTRVTFLCGERVFRDYKTAIGRIRALASVLSAAEPDLVETAQRLREEHKTTAKELEKLHTTAVLAEAESWMDEADRLGGKRVLVKEASLGPAALRTVAAKLVETPGRVVLLGSEAAERAHLVFARSADVDVDASELLRQALEAVGGRGGGSESVAQGGGPKTEGLHGALKLARASLESA